MTRDDTGFEGPVPGLGEQALARQDEIFRDTFPGMLGVKMLTAGAGFASGTLEVGTTVRHPGGYAHGGAIAGFGDTIAAWATFPALARGEIFTTIEFKTNFISGVTSGTLYGEATQIHRGGRTMVLQVRVTADGPEGKLVALMIVTQAILRDKHSGDAGSLY